jgi:hypothetical protein
LVATATLALQRQLIERDLPKIKAALDKELKRDISFAIYKFIASKCFSGYAAVPMQKFVGSSCTSSIM